MKKFVYISIMLIFPTLVHAVTYTSPHQGTVLIDDAVMKGPWIDVRAYGAVGDGVTDDLSAINSAMVAASTAGGGIVFFPPGTYLTSDTIELKSNVVAVGSGQRTTTIYLSGADAPILSASGASSSSRIARTGAMNMTLTSSYAGTGRTSNDGIYILHSNTNNTFRNLEIRIVGGWGINIAGDSFENYFYDISLSRSVSGGIRLHDDDATGGEDSNDNKFFNTSFFVYNQDQKLLSVEDTCSENVFTNTTVQSLTMPSGDWVINMEGERNSIRGWKSFDTTNQTSTKGYIYFNSANGNKVEDAIFYGYTGGYPMVTFNNSEDNFLALDRTGTPSYIYSADSSSQANEIKMNDGTYKVESGNVHTPSSTQIYSYWNPEDGPYDQKLYDIIGKEDTSVLAGNAMKFGRYFVAIVGSPGLTQGDPVRLRHNVSTDDQVIRVYTADPDTGAINDVIGAMGYSASSGSFVRVITEGRVEIDDLDCSGATAGDPIYVDTDGTPTLSVPSVDHAIIYAWTMGNANPCEAYVYANHNPEYAKAGRLNMERFTTVPSGTTMENEGIATAVVGNSGGLIYKSGGTYYNMMMPSNATTDQGIKWDGSKWIATDLSGVGGGASYWSRSDSSVIPSTVTDSIGNSTTGVTIYLDQAYSNAATHVVSAPNASGKVSTSWLGSSIYSGNGVLFYDTATETWKYYETDDSTLQVLLNVEDANSAYAQTFVDWTADQGASNIAQANVPIADAADALSANPANCSAGSAALGVAADGTAEGCFDVLTPAEGDAAYSETGLNAHATGTGADHTYIDQDVTSGSSPTFDGTNFSGILDEAVSDTITVTIPADDTFVIAGTPYLATAQELPDIGPRSKDRTITALGCKTDSGSVILYFRECSALDCTSTTDVPASPITCDSDGATATTISNAVIDAGDMINAYVGTDTSDPTSLTIWWYATMDSQ